MIFYFLSNSYELIKPKDVVGLYYDNWDDFGNKTTFNLIYYDNYGKPNQIGTIKIAYNTSSHNLSGNKTYSEFKLKTGKNFFLSLPNEYFSLGQDIDFYINLKNLEKNKFEEILSNLNDILYKPELITKFEHLNIFKSSLLRFINLKTIKKQFDRIIEGKLPLSEYKFKFIRKHTNNIGELTLSFEVKPNSKPSSNIHAIIGRNGAGKTSLLKDMVKSFLKTDTELHSSFYKEIYADRLFETTNNLIEIEEDYFNKLVLVSFNIFDSYITNNKKYKNYYYIGLKESENKLKELNSYFENDFYESLINCKIIKSKKDRWLKAIQNLESDDNFFEMHLNKLMDEDITKEQIITQIKNMSSGHATVLVTISQLVDKVEEKTLVLFDEPESHLHPPLLSAFIRALSDLLDNRNGVAIIATHSPIILQEIPKSCVWKIVRSGIETKAYRPKEKTFGENVGILTNEVFGFEVHKSGFHKLLQEQVDKGDSYEQILKNFNNQLGNEGQFLLRTLLKFRKNNGEQ